MSETSFGLYYYSSENSRAEVDFLLQTSHGIIPLEVKAEENLQAKSLRVYQEKYRPEICIRTSMSNYRKQDWLINIPLYSISTLRDPTRIEHSQSAKQSESLSNTPSPGVP